MKQLLITLLIFSALTAAWPGRLESSSYTYRAQRAFVDETMKIARDYRLRQKLKSLEAAMHREAARQLAARLGLAPGPEQAAPAPPAASRFQANAARLVPSAAGSS